MSTQLDKLFAKGLAIPARDTWGRQIAAEQCGSRVCPVTYVLHQVTPTLYNIIRVNLNGKVNGAVRVPLAGVCYVAGPMRGIPKNNFPAFDDARDRLIDAKFFVFNPADMDRAVGVTEDTTVFPPFFLRDAMDRDCNAICRSTHICLLPGWEDSSGVRPEAVLGDTFGDLTFISEHYPTSSPPQFDTIPGQAVCAVIGGRLVARYQKWDKEQDVVDRTAP